MQTSQCVVDRDTDTRTHVDEAAPECLELRREAKFQLLQVIKQHEFGGCGGMRLTKCNFGGVVVACFHCLRAGFHILLSYPFISIHSGKFLLTNAYKCHIII